MKRSELNVIYSLLVFFTLLFIASCNEDDNNTSDLYAVTSDIRTKVIEGIKAIEASIQNGFYEKLEALTEICNSPELTKTSSIDPHFETEEYNAFKEFIISASPESYYLLIEVFLKGEGNIGPFGYMFQDIVEACYPGLINEVLDKLESTTMDQFVIAYPQVCVELLLAAIEGEINR